MDLFKLGMRNFFGIVLPGAILLLVISYGFFTITSALGWPLLSSLWMADRQSLTLIVLFLLSYLLGSLMRLNSADKLDEKSGKLLQKEFMRRKGLSRGACEIQARKAWEALQPEPSNMDVPWDLVEGVYEFDPFPYPIWQFWRLKLYRPREAYIFFLQYKDCMRQDHVIGGTTATASYGKSFFNYCRTVLYHARRQAGDLLVAETQSLEAEVRFFAGTYYALFTGAWITCVCLAAQLALYRSVLMQIKLSDHRTLTLLFTVLLLITMYLMKTAILKRFRTLRIKEVDTLLDAFYLVHRHARSCPECAADSPKATGDSAVPEQAPMEQPIGGLSRMP